MTETMKILKERVFNGASYLRTIDPEWFKKVNSETINLNSSINCILGQVFGDFCSAANKMMKQGFNISDFDDSFAKHGFNLALFHDKEDMVNLTELWRSMIKKLQN